MSGGGVFQGGRNGSVPGLISIAQNLLNKPAPDTVEFGGTALHDTVGDMAGFYLQFKNGAFWWEGNTGSKPAGAAGAGTRMMWIPAEQNFVAASASGTQLDNVGFVNAIFGQDNRVTGFSNLVHGSNNAVSGSTNVVTGSDNTFSGNTSFVNGNFFTDSGTIINYNHNFISGQQNNITGVIALQNYLNGIQVQATNSPVRNIISGFRQIVNASQDSLVMASNPNPNPITTVSARNSAILGNNISGSFIQSFLVGDQIVGTGTTNNSLLIGGPITNQGNSNVISGNTISNTGSKNFLFGDSITVAKDGVIFFQYQAGLPSFYVELERTGQSLGVGYGVTSVANAYVNYRAGNATKAVQNYVSAAALKAAPVTGDFEADANRLYYTKTPGTRETLAYLSDIGATLDYVTFEYNIANATAIGNILTNQANGYCITIPFNATIQGVSVIAQTATAGTLADTMTFSVREVTGNGQSGNPTDIVFNSGTQIRTLVLGAGANAGARFNRLNLDATASGTVTGGNMLMVSVTNIVGAYSATNVLFRVVLKRL